MNIRSATAPEIGDKKKTKNHHFNSQINDNLLPSLVMWTMDKVNENITTFNV